MGAGLFIKASDSEIPLPWIAGATWWFSTVAMVMFVWDGVAWVPKAPAGSSSGGIWVPAPYIKGVITEPSMQMLVHMPTEQVTLPATALNKSKAMGTVAATGTATFSLQKNGVEVGTMEWAAAATLATFTVATATSFDPASNDWFGIVGPATPDATLANITASIHMTR